jgi:hypothetical protein
VDGWIPETRTYFQFHAPRLRVRPQKFRRYLEQAGKHNPAKWVFITNRDPTRAQWKWLKEATQRVSFPTEIWGAVKLTERLSKHPDLLEHFLPSSGSKPHVIVGKQRADHISNIAADTVNFNVRGQRRSRLRIFVPGVVATEPKKLGYLKDLVHHYQRWKESEVGKGKMKYPVIYRAYQRHVGYNVSETPLEKFDEACRYLQERIENTKQGRINRGMGKKLYDSFDEFAAR